MPKPTSNFSRRCLLSTQSSFSSLTRHTQNENSKFMICRNCVGGSSSLAASASSQLSRFYSSKPTQQKDAKFSKDSIKKLLQRENISDKGMMELAGLLKDYEDGTKAMSNSETIFDMEKLIKEMREEGEIKSDPHRFLRLAFYLLCVVAGVLFLQIFSLSRQVAALEKELEVQKRLVHLKWKKKMAELLGEDVLEGKLTVEEAMANKSVPEATSTAPAAAPPKKKFTLV